MNIYDKYEDYWMRLAKGAEIVILSDLRPPPYGGGNQFLLALRRELIRQGHSVGINRPTRRSRVMLFNSFNFDFDRLRSLRRSGMRMVHRVDGPISVYRGKDEEIDVNISRLNMELADATVFQSNYSFEKHKEMGLSFVNPVVIPNASDGNIFFPAKNIDSARGSKIKLVATSWSDNPMKGGDVYRWLDQNLDFNRYQFTFVGRTKERFQNIRISPPVDSRKVAAILRKHHLFVTASRNDCCSNSLIEALSCGLPALYHDSGGSRELTGNAGFGFTSPEQIPRLLERCLDTLVSLRRAIRVPTIREVGERYLSVLLA